jgi:hypothetical protein
MFLWPVLAYGQTLVNQDSLWDPAYYNFYQKQGIMLDKYDYSSPEINLYLQNTLDSRARRKINYVGAIITGTLAATCFALVQKDEANEYTTDSFVPLTNMILITSGSCLTISFAILTLRARKSHKLMKENIVLSKKGLAGYH